MNNLPRVSMLSRAYDEASPVAKAVRLPNSRIWMSPAHGAYSRKLVFSTPVPLVAVSTAFLRPRRPRVGMRYLTRWVALAPSPVVPISNICPLRCDSRSTTCPMCSWGTSTSASSYGSHFLSLIILVMTVGGPTANSYPSRLMFSMRMEMCRAPRPETMNESDVSPGSTLSARLRSSSLSSLSLMLREVTNLPSLPAKGEVLTRKVMRTVGSSTVMVGRAAGYSGWQMVSPMDTFCTPMKAQMSPACTSSTPILEKLL
mmetsp:Transcript_11194/g.33574  ORF Transcript_11194/g.33574 Transcript_11194/m.33574 type:complete len:258 (+) Transcript_11194:754-1527(+)